jgi:bifunctional non-homologous end joining protein LigD
MPTAVQPMLATLGALPTAGEWGYEFKWDGVRTIAYINGDELRLLTRTNDDVTQTGSGDDLVEPGGRWKSCVEQDSLA